MLRSTVSNIFITEAWVIDLSTNWCRYLFCAYYTKNSQIYHKIFSLTLQLLHDSVLNVLKRLQPLHITPVWIFDRLSSYLPTDLSFFMNPNVINKRVNIVTLWLLFWHETRDHKGDLWILHVYEDKIFCFSITGEVFPWNCCKPHGAQKRLSVASYFISCFACDIYLCLYLRQPMNMAFVYK